MGRIFVRIVPVKVEGEPLRHQAVCYTHGCTLGVDGQPWATSPQPVKAGVEELARLHRGDHRAPDRPPVSTASAVARPVQDIHLPE